MHIETASLQRLRAERTAAIAANEARQQEARATREHANARARELGFAVASQHLTFEQLERLGSLDGICLVLHLGGMRHGQFVEDALGVPAFDGRAELFNHLLGSDHLTSEVAPAFIEGVRDVYQQVVPA